DHELHMPQKGYTRIAFSPNGKTLAAIGNHLFVLWDVASGELIAHPFKGPLGQFETVAFGPDGRTVVTGAFDGQVLQWDVSIDSWMAQACSKANRNFSEEEWVRVSPGASYERICPQLPIDTSLVNKTLERAKAAGMAQEAVASLLYAQAAEQATETEDSVLNNQVCWFGSIDGFARIVLPACERAVTLAPHNPGWRDSRAIAKALVGDTSAAVTDLEFFVARAQDRDDLRKYVPTRKQWLEELAARRNPFDPRTLAILRGDNL